MSEHEFRVGDRVLVPGVVKRVRPGASARVEFNDGDELWLDFDNADLRSDTGGRDLTAQDVQAVPTHGWDDAEIVFNRIARPAARPAGDDTAEVPPLRCTRCGGEIEVETTTSGYYRETEVVGITCEGQMGPDYRPGCGARWGALGIPKETQR